MQKAVRDVGVVLDWLRGTKTLLEKDDAQFKAVAKQKLNIQTDAAWESKRQELLQQLNTALANAQNHAVTAVNSATPPSTKPFVPSERFTALFQSAMEEHLNHRFTSAALARQAGTAPPYGPPEKYDSGDLGWSVVLLARLEEGLRGKKVFVHSTDLTAFRYDMPDTTSVALFADWGTGEASALAVKAAIEKESPEFTIHLGDTYYAGFGDEISHNLVSCWPWAARSCFGSHATESSQLFFRGGTLALYFQFERNRSGGVVGRTHGASSKAICADPDRQHER